jgi:hypothetical protein
MADEDDEVPGSEALLDEDDPMNPAAWYREPNICGSCIAWRPDDPRPGEDVASGACKLRPELGRVPATLKKCSIYKPRGLFTYQPGSTPTKRKRVGPARVLRRSAEGQLVPSRPPPRTTPLVDYDDLDREEVIEEPLEPEEDAGGEERPEGQPRPSRPTDLAPKELDLGPEESAAAVHQALVELIRREHGKVSREIHSKFRTGGKATAEAEGARVEVTAERFFSFIDRYRSSLEACEQAIVSTPGLAEEKEELVGLLRRMQGSFTTFNILFADREDYFSGKE